MPSPYQPLGDYLAGQLPSTPTVTLTLAAIEHLIGRALPAGASTQTWWTTPRYRDRPRPWLVAGWRVAGVAMRTVPLTVTFARVTMPPRPGAR